MDSLTNEDMLHAFEALYGDYMALENAVQENANVETVSVLEGAWQEHAAMFRAMWERWDRAVSDESDACYIVLLSSDHRRDWIDAAQRGRCLMEACELNAHEIIDATAALAAENVFAWMAWVFGVERDILEGVRDEWEYQGMPETYKAVGAIGLEMFLEQEQELAKQDDEEE